MNRRFSDLVSGLRKSQAASADAELGGVGTQAGQFKIRAVWRWTRRETFIRTYAEAPESSELCLQA